MKAPKSRVIADQPSMCRPVGPMHAFAVASALCRNSLHGGTFARAVLVIGSEHSRCT
jgi:hypothetical protein